MKEHRNELKDRNFRCRSSLV